MIEESISRAEAFTASERKFSLLAMLPRFTIADLLVAVTGLAITLTLWQRIPAYEDWLWNHDLLTYETPEPPREFTEHRTAIDHPTPFGTIFYENGVNLFRDCHQRGFEDAVDEFFYVGKCPPPIDDVVMEHPENWPEAHYLFAGKCGYSDGVQAINDLLATRDESMLLVQLDRDRSYHKKYYPLFGFLIFLVLLVTVRIFRGGYIVRKWVAT